MQNANTEKKWPRITETTSNEERSAGLRSFRIQSSHTTWKVKGQITKIFRLRHCPTVILFELVDYPGYNFKMEDQVIRGFKKFTNRISDSGNLACHDNRFNLVNKKGERKTVRLEKLIEYLPKAFEC